MLNYEEVTPLTQHSSFIQGDTKNGNFWKTQQKLKKSPKKFYWQTLNHYNLRF